MTGRLHAQRQACMLHMPIAQRPFPHLCSAPVSGKRRDGFKLADSVGTMSFGAFFRRAVYMEPVMVWSLMLYGTGACRHAI